MSTEISPMACVDPKAEIGRDVFIGPFCVVGPSVSIGDESRLECHATIIGNTSIGARNRFFPGTVIGGEPQDKSFRDTETYVEIGDDNVFREGVTVNRGAEKEDAVTRIDNHNLLMANSHVAHNCHVFDNTILVNGVLLGGHVHVHDGAIISGNSVVHHFSTVGTLAFVSGGCRVPHDIPPYMLAAGSDNPTIKTLNLVGMKRAGISSETISVVRDAFRLLFRKKKKLAIVQEEISQKLDGHIPTEVARLFSFLELQQKGRMGRGREAVRKQDPQAQQKAA